MYIVVGTNHAANDVPLQFIGETAMRMTLYSHPHATHSWVCLMMRLKSFRPEVNKSWRVMERMQKKKKSPINNFKTKMIS
jgi:hypothetical protein